MSVNRGGLAEKEGEESIFSQEIENFAAFTPSLSRMKFYFQLHITTKQFILSVLPSRKVHRIKAEIIMSE